MVNTVFPLNPSKWPLRYLDQITADEKINLKGMKARFIQWVPKRLDLFDPRFGLLKFRHCLLIELFPTKQELENNSSNSEEQDEKQVVLIGLSNPFVSLIAQREIPLTRILGEITLLKLESFYEKKQFETYAKQVGDDNLDKEYELSTLVHDINNTVQDLTLLCDSIHDLIGKKESKTSKADPDINKNLNVKVKQIAVIARSMATIVSDAKRKRELEKLDDLKPKEDVCVNEVIKDLIAFAKVRAERTRIEINLKNEIEEDLWTKISAREHLETILRNLLNNAILYSDPGSKVDVALLNDEDSIVIEVSDNGPGLSSEECKLIFLSGYRGEKGRTVKGGLGIGLAQSKRVAESAGGKLDVYSEGAGKGSTFTLVLPRFYQKYNSTSSQRWALMVDDQPALTSFYSRLAKGLNLVPEVASSVNQAIEILEEKGKPIFVLTDLHLGKSYGLDLVKFVRNKYGNNIPILVVSGINDDDIEQKVKTAGATDFVTKPIGRQALFARIQSLL